MRFLFQYQLNKLILSLLFFIIIVTLFPKYILSSCLAGLLFTYFFQQVTLAFWIYSQKLPVSLFLPAYLAFFIFKLTFISLIIIGIVFITELQIIPFLLSFLIGITVLLLAIFFIGLFQKQSMENILNKEGGR